ncbi:MULTISPECIES: ABC transporter permease [unclassified Streptomyces]|uniref:ABC transporter permease n=1 Tax=unclassified Streptomyces TaxID=2593676 RepID=UPI002E809B10|nr:ABC transporter permease [Streptomyces sp. NBC_00589]WTI42574.1 ABC transporter permease [Streptomyces sp. NBC_00775]WUB33206.1 ABC transporter permease [Streptomyces sp. NBC_00589]
MPAYLAKRLGYYAVLLLAAVCLSYLLASFALDPREYYEGRQPPVSASAVDHHLTEIGVNDHEPLLTRFLRWAGHAVRGDLGRTIDDTSVNAEFGRRIGVSLRLLLAGTVLGTVAGVLVGAWTAVRQYRFSDRAVTLASFALLSTPVFLLAILLKTGAIWFNQKTGTDLIQFTGEKSPGLEGGFWAVLRDRAVHLLLPTLSVALFAIASYSRYQRNTMLDVLGSDYLRTARAKGLGRRTVLLRHGLRTALIPMSTYFSYGFLALFTGATFTETIFGWHGMGEWFVSSIGKNDVNSVVAVNVFAAVTVLLSGFLADVLHAALDPRIRQAS